MMKWSYKIGIHIYNSGKTAHKEASNNISNHQQGYEEVDAEEDASDTMN